MNVIGNKEQNKHEYQSMSLGKMYSEQFKKVIQAQNELK